MSSDDHNKVLGALHLVFGCINGLALSAGFGLFSRAPAPPGTASWEEVAIRLIFFLLLCFPFLIAGYGMLKRAGWAHGAGVIAAIVASLSPPFGTALCVYSLWFLFGEGKTFYGSRPGVSWSSSASKSAETSAPPFESGSRAPGDGGEGEGYVPPAQPPNWRD